MEIGCSANTKIKNSLITPSLQSKETLQQLFQLNLISPKFAINTKLLNQVSNHKHHIKSAMEENNMTFEELHLFEALPVGKSNSKTFFTGAPVWSMAWCPYPTHENELDQVLAVCTHSQEHIVNAAQTYEEPVLLQLWNCGKLPATDKCNQVWRHMTQFGNMINLRN